MTVHYAPASDLLDAWEGDLTSGTPPVRYPVAEDGNPLADIDIGPGRVTLFGGQPGAGKTALVTQLVTDALRLTQDLRAAVANVEMHPAVLLDRQLSRLSGIPLTDVRSRQLAGYDDRLAAGLATVRDFAPRLAFVQPPYSIENVARTADGFAADVVVLDYVQRIAPPGGGLENKKAAVDAVMDHARRFAACGVAVILVAAVARQKDDRGRSGYAGLSLASFRDSSELEYGADDAFLLERRDEDDPSAVTLRHVKSRNGETRDIPLRFTGAVQRFDPDDGAGLSGAIADAWEAVGAAHGEGDSE